MARVDNHHYCKVSKDEVIAKMKDDGDFDRLRLKIIRKLKDNDELRNRITGYVRQSAALNQPGVENMKPRQISDAIFEEVGNGAMSDISDSVWEIIRSEGGMKIEIKETVQSVYDELVNPKRKQELVNPKRKQRNEESSSKQNSVLAEKESEPHGSSSAAIVGDVDETMDDAELEEPPGFSLSHCEVSLENLKEETCHSKNIVDQNNVVVVMPPQLVAENEHQQPYGASDDDPDVPPGFG